MMPLPTVFLFISYFYMDSHLHCDTFDSTPKNHQSFSTLSRNFLNMSLPASCSAIVNAYRKRVLSACHHAPRTCIIVFLSLVALHTSIRAQARHEQALQVSLQKQLLDCTDSASYGLGAIISRVFRLSSAAVACLTASLLRKEISRMRWVLAFWGVSSLCLQ